MVPSFTPPAMLPRVWLQVRLPAWEGTSGTKPSVKDPCILLRSYPVADMLPRGCKEAVANRNHDAESSSCEYSAVTAE